MASVVGNVQEVTSGMVEGGEGRGDDTSGTPEDILKGEKRIENVHYYDIISYVIK